MDIIDLKVVRAEVWCIEVPRLGDRLASVRESGSAQLKDMGRLTFGESNRPPIRPSESRAIQGDLLALA